MEKVDAPCLVVVLQNWDKAHPENENPWIITAVLSLYDDSKGNPKFLCQ